MLPASQVSGDDKFILYYIRDAQRIPLTGEFVNRTEFTGTDIIAATDIISIADHGLKSGDVIHIETESGTSFGTAGTEYWVTKIDADNFKVSSSLLNYRLGTFINLTAITGEYYFEVQVDETIQDAWVLDIPEFTSFVIQFMKVRCYEKEPDPRYDNAVVALTAHQKQMVDTLTDRTPDNDDKVEMDMSFYYDHN